MVISITKIFLYWAYDFQLQITFHKIIKFLEDNNIYDSSTLIALGDHSFKDASYVIKLNKLFIEKGYIKVNKENKIISWDVYCNYCDGSAYIYINNNIYKEGRINKLKIFLF